MIHHHILLRVRTSAQWMDYCAADMPFRSVLSGIIPAYRNARLMLMLIATTNFHFV